MGLVTWLITRLVHWFGVDILELFQDEVHKRVDVHKAVEAQDLDPSEEWPEELDPIEKVKALHDDPGKLYVWILDEESSVSACQDWAERINGIYREAYGRVPRANHIAVRQIHDIRTLSADEQRELLQPYTPRKGEET